jgi:hypothetical protein
MKILLSLPACSVANEAVELGRGDAVAVTGGASVAGPGR